MESRKRNPGRNPTRTKTEPEKRVSREALFLLVYKPVIENKTTD